MENLTKTTQTAKDQRIRTFKNLKIIDLFNFGEIILYSNNVDYYTLSIKLKAQSEDVHNNSIESSHISINIIEYSNNKILIDFKTIEGGVYTLKVEIIDNVLFTKITYKDQTLELNIHKGMYLINHL